MEIEIFEYAVVEHDFGGLDHVAYANRAGFLEAVARLTHKLVVSSETLATPGRVAFVLDENELIGQGARHVDVLIRVEYEPFHVRFSRFKDKDINFLAN